MSEIKERKKKFKSHSQIEIQRTYSEKDLSDFDPDCQLSLPGEYPFTRGLHPTMYRGKFWTMRQYAGFGTAKESNERYRFLLSQGQTGLSVAFDLPTQVGLDSDHAMAKGEVGKVGVAVDSLKDMEILFDKIPMDKVSVSMTINATAAVLLAMYLALAEKRGYAWTDLSGTVQNDILKEYIARGTYIYPPKASLRIIMDILEFCHEKVPHWNTMSISGYHIREAGATAVQELAFTLSNAICYIKTALDKGFEIDSFAPRLSFFLASHNNLMEEIAKFRAARRLWARIMKEKFHAGDPNSLKFRFHTQTSGVTLTAQEPENNIIRVTLQALASVLGGTQSLHTNSRDEALSLPSQESAQIALRTQQIIAHESGVADTADPLGGSYYLETLTNQIEDRVWEYLKKIEDLGGTLKAIEAGYIQNEIQESAYLFQKEVEQKEQIIVGLNAFIHKEEKIDFELQFQSEKNEQVQKKNLQSLKKNRSNKDVKKALDMLRKAVQNEENLLPPIIAAVKDLATLGEISDLLREEFGIYQEAVFL